MLPSIAEIWRRHKKNGIIGGNSLKGGGKSRGVDSSDWTSARYHALCRMMNVTPHELGAMCAVRANLMTKYIKREHFPPTVALHLLMFEDVILEKQCGLKRDRQAVNISKLEG